MRNNFPMLRERYAVVAGLRVGGSLFLITLLFFAGCNPGGNNNISTTDSTKIQTTGADTGKGKDKAAMALIGAPLCIYYTDATTMYNLILKNPGPQGAARGKIVFQYFITKNDTLTLSAFSGEQHGQNYDVTSHMIILNA